MYNIIVGAKYLSLKYQLDLSRKCKLFVSDANVVLSKPQCISAHILWPVCNAITEEYSAIGSVARMMAMQGGERQTGERHLLFLGSRRNQVNLLFLYV